MTIFLGGAGRTNCQVRAKAAKTRINGDMAARVAQITSRELAVLKQIVAGQSNKLIARNLDLSPRTVEAHRARVMQKMQAGSVAELVSLALRAGIELDEELV